MNDKVLFLSLSVCVAFLLMVFITKARAGSIRIQIPPMVFRFIFVVLFLFLIAYAFAVFGGSLSFANIANIYDQRYLAGDLSAGTIAGYATGILSGCFNPLLIAYGLRYRLKSALLVGIAGQVFVYMTFAMKSVLLSVIIIPVFYYVCLRRDNISWRGIAGISIALLSSPLIMEIFIGGESSPVYDGVVALVYMRTFGMVGVLTGIYYDFFLYNPFTLYSHINIIGTFFEYPYNASVGEVIGASMGIDANANANFFATDGIAAAGLFGILIIGVVVGLAMRAFDAIIPSENLRMICAAAVPSIVNLANASFFTTLLTNGLFLLVVLGSAWRFHKQENVRWLEASRSSSMR
ncbi:hypothetical protein [Piscinibacter sakaiensis]|uniref:hypothetical protein n=1 Tax=Piscinibacter sakaiensis TaxID=1547922 RepID=UPI003AAE2BDA